MMKKRFIPVALGALMVLSLAGCGGSKAVTYKDGTYEGKSSVYEGDEEGNGDGYGVVTLTLSGGKITDCEFLTYQTDGTLKDEEYGKQNGEVANVDFYNKAQRAVLASHGYGEKLAETGDITQVDAVSGATISYKEFKEAVDNALAEAAQ